MFFLGIILGFLLGVVAMALAPAGMRTRAVNYFDLYSGRRARTTPTDVPPKPPVA